MELETIRECFILFLKFLGKQKSIIDLPSEREARDFAIEKIRSTVQIMYTSILISFPNPGEGINQDLVIMTTVYKQLIRMIKEYQGDKVSYYEKQIKELESEIAKLMDENYHLSQELEDSVLLSKKDDQVQVIKNVNVEPESKNSKSWFSFSN